MLYLRELILRIGCIEILEDPSNWYLGKYNKIERFSIPLLSILTPEHSKYLLGSVEYKIRRVEKTSKQYNNYIF